MRPAEIDTVELTGWERDGLAMRHNCVWRASFGLRELEFDSVEVDVRRQHFCGQCIALAIEAGCGVFAIVAGRGYIVGQWHGHRLNLVCLRACRRKAHSKGAWLVCAEGGCKRAVCDRRRTNRLFLTIYFSC